MKIGFNLWNDDFGKWWNSYAVNKSILFPGNEHFGFINQLIYSLIASCFSQIGIFLLPLIFLLSSILLTTKWKNQILFFVLVKTKKISKIKFKKNVKFKINKKEENDNQNLGGTVNEIDTKINDTILNNTLESDVIFNTETVENHSTNDFEIDEKINLSNETTSWTQPFDDPF
ncbi:hypothetical protein [[Mycoplasma] collis]|uniref:hypothetical protein n=1 Tax=[Mycoplasma] collis TaxID=2127 RepID=UPI0012EC54AD|nr:hypothetical protein [[Mycoplasma] collis]